MSEYYVQIGVGVLLAMFGFALATEGDAGLLGWGMFAIGSVLAQIGVIAAGVQQGTERLHRRLRSLDLAAATLTDDLDDDATT